MTTLNLLNPKCLEDLARFVTPRTLFAFDLDGTLAPFAVHAREVRLDPTLRAHLSRLDALAPVCVLTGRSREAALDILAMDLRLVIGNHGCEWPPGIRPRNRDFIEISRIWSEQLHRALSDLPGVEIEDKGETLAIHYRGAAEQKAALARIEKAIGHLLPIPRVIGGKFVLNLLPMAADTKGNALIDAVAQLGAARALYAGDDLTDEEVFRLEGVELFGVHIGRENWSAAAYYLEDQSEVAGVLGALVEMLEAQIQDAPTVLRN
jgi:trehalose 6-phosphate phosphatase